MAIKEVVMAYVVALHACGHLVALNIDLVGLPHVSCVDQQLIEQLLCRLHVLAQVLALRSFCVAVVSKRRPWNKTRENVNAESKPMCS